MRADLVTAKLTDLILTLTNIALMYTLDIYTKNKKAMIRTQIYLTAQQHSELKRLAKTLDKKQSKLIREAIDNLIAQSSSKRRKEILKNAAGIWKNRSDLPDFTAIRSEWDRN